MDDVKTCRVCLSLKSLDAYTKDRTKKLGITNICKECAKVASRKYYVNNSKDIKKRVTCYSDSYIPKHSRDIDSRLKNLCTNARNRNKEFCLVDQDIFDLWEKQDGQCAYSKLPLVALTNQFNTVSLDRIDSSVGYVVNNIQLVCAAINKMKQEYTQEVFLMFCHLVTKNNELSELPETLIARLVPEGI